MAQTVVEEPTIQESISSCGCGCEHIAHETAPDMPDEELLYDLADLFKVFADTTESRFSMPLWGVSFPWAIWPRLSALRKAPFRISFAP